MSLESEKTLTDSEKYTANQADGRPAKTPEEIEDFWTEERMKNAKPMPTPKSVMPDQGDAAIPEDGWPADSPPGGSPGAMPNTKKNPDPID